MYDRREAEDGREVRYGPTAKRLPHLLMGQHVLVSSRLLEKLPREDAERQTALGGRPFPLFNAAGLGCAIWFEGFGSLVFGTWNLG